MLIDGNAILHRAYHALPPLTALDGSPANAVYGFALMLFKIVIDLKPTHLAVTFDRPVPTFRKQMFAGYQAKRPQMAEELSNQIAKVHDVISAFGIPIYEIDGYEADDLLGTIAKKIVSDAHIIQKYDKQRMKKSHMDEVVIVTGDRDILQLVDDNKVHVYMPTRGISEGKIYYEKDVRERMGVTPKQIPDFKALAGDPSDNYPGVAGIGPKTAATLVTEFKSVENLYQAIKKKTTAAKKLSPAVLEKLAAGAEAAVMAKDLATIRCDVPIKCDLGQTRIETLDTSAAREELKKLGFKSLLKRLSGQRAEVKQQTLF